MTWSRLRAKHRKPLKWWFYKILCEIYYFLWGGGASYYKTLDKLCDTGFNLYGEKIIHPRKKKL